MRAVRFFTAAQPKVPTWGNSVVWSGPKSGSVVGLGRHAVDGNRSVAAHQFKYAVCQSFPVSVARWQKLVRRCGFSGGACINRVPSFFAHRSLRSPKRRHGWRRIQAAPHAAGLRVRGVAQNWRACGAPANKSLNRTHHGVPSAGPSFHSGPAAATPRWPG